MWDLRLEEDIERAEAGEKSESSIQLRMERVWRIARDDSDRITDVSTEELLNALDEVEKETPVVDALRGLVLWERENDYHDGAVPALEAFEELVEQGLEKEWYNVALYATIQAASLASAVSDEEGVSEWLEECIDLFEDHWEELTPNTRGNIIDTLPELHYVADEDVSEKIAATLRSVAEETEDRNYEIQRRILHSVKEVLRDLDRGTSDIEDEIIQSYSSEVEMKDGSPHQKAILLQEALDVCAEYAGEDQMIQWKREMREANREAIEKMPATVHEPADEEIEKIEEAVDEMVDNFRNLKRDEHTVAALYALLSNPSLVPQLDETDTSDAAPLLEMVSKRHMKSEGDSIPDPEEDSRPSMYHFGVQYRDNILFAVLRRVFSQGVLTEGDLFLYLEAVDDLTVHDRAYLTDFIIAVFEERFAEALHLGVPRLEGLIASELKAKGYETASLKEGYTTPTPMPGLLNMLEGKVDENLVEYLKYRYSDISGEGLRNKVAHGRAYYQHANRRRCFILLYDIFRTIAWLEDELTESTV